MFQEEETGQVDFDNPCTRLVPHISDCLPTSAALFFLFFVSAQPFIWLFTAYSIKQYTLSFLVCEFVLCVGAQGCLP